MSNTQLDDQKQPYPVRADAAQEPSASRWRWLGRWLLLIPHFIVLFFLWVAFFGVSVVAVFAILFTGRYPRPLFDFNVGVLRRTWRVHYYGYGALVTDRYPPLTLAEVPDYPAHLDVAYPERLSRGPVLVKWWLLAIPQYIVVSILVGGGAYAGSSATTDSGWGVGGLVGLLVLIAAVVLLFTARYPKPLYDLSVLNCRRRPDLGSERRQLLHWTCPGSRPVKPTTSFRADAPAISLARCSRSTDSSSSLRTPCRPSAGSSP